MQTHILKTEGVQSNKVERRCHQDTKAAIYSDTLDIRVTLRWTHVSAVSGERTRERENTDHREECSKKMT